MTKEVPTWSIATPLEDRTVCPHCKVLHSMYKIGRMTNEAADICMRSDYNTRVANG